MSKLIAMLADYGDCLSSITNINRIYFSYMGFEMEQVSGSNNDRYIMEKADMCIVICRINTDLAIDLKNAENQMRSYNENCEFVRVFTRSRYAINTVHIDKNDYIVDLYDHKTYEDLFNDLYFKLWGETVI